MTRISTTPFDPAAHLGDVDIQAEMLSEALATGDRRLVAHVLNTIARAKGMSSVATATGINRTTLYAALAEDSNPTLETLFKVVDALGLKLGATAATQTA
ncbi:addiction module antidote protein [Sphingomonas sp.]|uniref:addiction module antidote protein n=1 Tax=Sphingomonas sp. TaxID=28214 RepID=UPI0035BC4900